MRIAVTGLMLLGLAGTGVLASAHQSESATVSATGSDVEASRTHRGVHGIDGVNDVDGAGDARTPVLSAPSPVDLPESGGAPRSLSTSIAVTYEWPLPPGTVTRPFDQPDAPWLSGHRGVDLSGMAGDRVLAAADGVVAFVGMVAGKSVVSIDHADGIRTTYEPVISSLSAGDRVQRGSVIGTLTLGHGLTPALHWGARVGEDYLDPVQLIEAPVVIRLYPE